MEVDPEVDERTAGRFVQVCCERPRSEDDDAVRIVREQGLHRVIARLAKRSQIVGSRIHFRHQHGRVRAHRDGNDHVVRLSPRDTMVR